MDALTRAKKEISEAVSRVAVEKFTVSARDIAPPPQLGMGDLAYACFDAAKTLGQSPVEVALAIVAEFIPTSLVMSATAHGPYVNFMLERIGFGTKVLEESLGNTESYGSSDRYSETVMIEYAQQNTHKEVHVGHLRNLAVGLSVSRLLAATGYKIVQVSYPGDIGSHVAKCLWALKNFHANDPPPINKGEFLGRVYADAVRRIELDPSLKMETEEVQRKLEARDPEWDKLWRETREWSIQEFAQIHGELGIAFDKTYYESEVEEEGKQMVADLLTQSIARKSEGATIVDLEAEGLGAFLILKSDGSALYATKELAVTRRKFADYHPDESIVIVDSRQSLYFKQFFATLRRLGNAARMTHLGYEFVTLKSGAMSSRKGNIVSYEDFRDEMHARAAEETKKQHPEWSGDKVKEVSWAVAEGAIKFGMLKQDLDRQIVFDMESALSFDGFTGPYVQYAHARLTSILAKAGGVLAGAEEEASGDEKEFALLRAVADLPGMVQAAAEQRKPSLMAQYLFELAQAVNAFYRDVPVAGAREGDRQRRIRIARAAQVALARGLYLLGIRAPEEM